MEPIGFIFTGGPNSVYEAGAPKADPAIFELGVPVLGICYGCQLMAHTLGGQVTEAPRTPPGNTARPRPITTPPASSSKACQSRASPG